MAYGHGLSVSLLQLARAYMMFARDGDIMPLSFVKRDEPPVGQQVISPKTARPCAPCWRSVVGPGGTASQGPGPGLSRGRQDRHRGEDRRRPLCATKNIVSFVGFAPASQAALHRRRDDRQAARRGSTTAATSPRRSFAQVMAGALRVMACRPTRRSSTTSMPPEGEPGGGSVMAGVASTERR